MDTLWPSRTRKVQQGAARDTRGKAAITVIITDHTLAEGTGHDAPIDGRPLMQ